MNKALFVVIAVLLGGCATPGAQVTYVTPVCVYPEIPMLYYGRPVCMYPASVYIYPAVGVGLNFHYYGGKGYRR